MRIALSWSQISLLAASIFVLPSPVYSQASDSLTQATTKAPYVVEPGRIDDNGLPVSPATLILGTGDNKHVFTAPYNNPSFGLNPVVEACSAKTGERLLLFSAVASAGGSGTSVCLNLLEERSDGLVDLLPGIVVSSQSAHRLWTFPSISDYPALVTAVAIWATGEPHFAPHRYKITAYTRNPYTGYYVKRIDYATKRKFDLDQQGQENALMLNEKSHIKVLLEKIPKDESPEVAEAKAQTLKDYVDAVTQEAALSITMTLDPQALAAGPRLQSQLQKSLTTAEQRRTGLLAVMRKKGYLRDPEFTKLVQAKVSELSRILAAISPQVFSQMPPGQQRSVLVIGQIETQLRNLQKH